MDAAPARIAILLEGGGIESDRRSEREWVVHLPSAKRGAVTVGLIVRERTLAMEAFFIRRPDRDCEAVYRRLLRKNLDMYAWRFALDGAGDVFLVAQTPVEGLSADTLDRLLGALATYVDETFEGVFRTGFDVQDGTVVGPPPGRP